MFKTAVIYRVNQSWAPPPQSSLLEALEKWRFAPCSAAARESFGWVPPRGKEDGPLVEYANGQLVFKLMVESKMLPAAVVREAVDLQVKKRLQDSGRKRIGARERKEIKEQVEFDLLPKAFTKKSVTTVWLSTNGQIAVIDSASAAKTDRVTKLLVEVMTELQTGLALRPLMTKMSPAIAMAHWLQTQEAPYNFSIDDECELKSSDVHRATVRYSRHTLDINEIVEHILHGKAPTRVALTFKGRISFLLTDSMALKKLTCLDVVMQERDSEIDPFDADFALISAEILDLVPSLVDALDGELPVDKEMVTSERQSSFSESQVQGGMQHQELDPAMLATVDV